MSSLSAAASSNRQAVPICSFYAQGKCRRGAACRFRHEDEQSSTDVSMNKKSPDTPICSFYIRGDCRKGKSCEFRHAMPEFSPQQIKAKDVAAKQKKKPVEVPQKRWFYGETGWYYGTCHPQPGEWEEAKDLRTKRKPMSSLAAAAAAGTSKQQSQSLSSSSRERSSSKSSRRQSSSSSTSLTRRSLSKQTSSQKDVAGNRASQFQTTRSVNRVEKSELADMGADTFGKQSEKLSPTASSFTPGQHPVAEKAVEASSKSMNAEKLPNGIRNTAERSKKVSGMSSLAAAAAAGKAQVQKETQKTASPLTSNENERKTKGGVMQDSIASIRRDGEEIDQDQQKSRKSDNVASTRRPHDEEKPRDAKTNKPMSSLAAAAAAGKAEQHTAQSLRGEATNERGTLSPQKEQRSPTGIPRCSPSWSPKSRSPAPKSANHPPYNQKTPIPPPIPLLPGERESQIATEGQATWEQPPTPTAHTASDVTEETRSVALASDENKPPVLHTTDPKSQKDEGVSSSNAISGLSQLRIDESDAIHKTISVSTAPEEMSPLAAGESPARQNRFHYSQTTPSRKSNLPAPRSGMSSLTRAAALGKQPRELKTIESTSQMGQGRGYTTPRKTGKPGTSKASQSAGPTLSSLARAAAAGRQAQEPNKGKQPSKGSKRTPIWERLYEDGKRKQERQKNVKPAQDAECTFSPDIKSSSTHRFYGDNSVANSRTGRYNTNTPRSTTGSVQRNDRGQRNTPRKGVPRVVDKRDLNGDERSVTSEITTKSYDPSRNRRSGGKKDSRRRRAEPETPSRTKGSAKRGDVRQTATPSRSSVGATRSRGFGNKGTTSTGGSRSNSFAVASSGNNSTQRRSSKNVSRGVYGTRSVRSLTAKFEETSAKWNKGKEPLEGAVDKGSVNVESETNKSAVRDHDKRAGEAANGSIHRRAPCLSHRWGDDSDDD